MQSEHVIVVDLDGTLINSDMLIENVFLFLTTYPLRIFSILIWLLGGKANLKRRLADAVLPSAENLPYNTPLLAWLKQQQEAGAKLVLATASDSRIAHAVSNHLGIFDDVLGTKHENLSSHQKQAALIARFGEKGYSYVGNSHADLAVWRSAAVIHIANPSIGVVKAAKKLGNIGKLFTQPSNYFNQLIRSIRIHQATKNILVFVPLIASHRSMALA